MTNSWLLTITTVLMVSCSGDEPSGISRQAHIEKRQDKAEAALNKTPMPRTYNLYGNQLLVVEVPVADSSGFIDGQRCFVWRDAEFKTATMSCGQQPDVLLSN